MDNKKVIAIIPARGGSKRIPGKNIKILAGKPLIAYTIEAALKCKYLQRIIVSTEDKEIAEVSKKYGSEIIERPKELATDESPDIYSVLHVLKILEKQKYIPDIVIRLQAVSPLINAKDIDGAVSLFLKEKCESVFSVCEIHPSPYWSFKKEGRYLKTFFGKKYLLTRSQDLPKAYVHNGAICISAPKIIKKYKSFYTDKILPYIMPKERSIDIDEEADFYLAEALIKNEKNKNRK